MGEFIKGVPNPLNSPIEKFAFPPKAPPSSEALYRELRAENIPDEEARKFASAFTRYADQHLMRDYDFQNVLEYWANRHTHPNTGGGDSGTPEPSFGAFHVVGGNYTGASQTTNVRSYLLETNTWETDIRIPEPPLATASTHRVRWDGGYKFAIPHNWGLQLFDFNTGEWTLSSPAPREHDSASMTLVYNNDWIFVLGPGTLAGYDKLIYAYSIEDDTWNDTLTPSPEFLHGGWAMSHQGIIYVCPSARTGGTYVHKYNISEDTWDTETGLLLPPSYGGSFPAYGICYGKMWISSVNGIISFDPVTETFIERASNLPTSGTRARTGIVPLGVQQVFLALGKDTANLASSTRNLNARLITPDSSDWQARTPGTSAYDCALLPDPTILAP